MQSIIDFSSLLASASCSSGDSYESITAFEHGFPYIRELEISFALESEDGERQVSLYGETVRVNSVGVLSGTLILGSQACCDGECFATLCDDCSGDLCVVATELKNTGILDDFWDAGYDVLVIRSLELSRELVDAANLREFFDRIPCFVFQRLGVMPQICCNLIADVEGYYREQEEQTKYDPRSAGEDSIRIFIENGYGLTESGRLLIRVHDREVAEVASLRYDYDDESACFAEELANWQSTSHVTDAVKAMRAAASRRVLEDHISIGAYGTAVHIPRDTPSELVSYMKAAVVAYNLGTTFDYALNHFVSEEMPHIPAIHLAFQEMYYAGMRHIEETQRRMRPQLEPTAGEVFADSALTRAVNSYYVAALLYREGHMIEAHAMSRLLLEQIAWSFSSFEKQNREEAEKVAPTKAIGKLKRKIEPVGRLYGMLSQYVHLPLKGHDEFVDLSSGQSAALLQFGAHSYYHGQILAYLADYWASVYEHTQMRHFDELENWTEEDSGLVLNPNRPFLKTIGPYLDNLKRIYSEEYPTFREFIESNWSLKSDD